MRLLAGVAVVVAMTSGSALGAPDDTRCPVEQVHVGAGVALEQSDVSAQPTGTVVTCRYKSNGGSNFAGSIGFRALCPDGKLLRFPGYTFSYPSQNQYVTGIVAIPDAAGNERAEVLMWRNGKPDTIQITAVATCAK